MSKYREKSLQKLMDNTAAMNSDSIDDVITIIGIDHRH